MSVKRKMVTLHEKVPPLHALLLKAAPAREDGTASVATLAEALGITRARVYQWIKRGKMPPWQARKAVSLSEGRLTMEELEPYINNSAQSRGWDRAMFGDVL